ncbi:hypothetical protein B0H10DRAFT_1962292 [Mycena sp. CBHHK59/15]|nr:hypothetical protein B0H10DRAFT_1962292 [Mycena sp. CBHHK59/15]
MLIHLWYAEINWALDKGIRSLRKWFHRVNTTSDAYLICLVLDPNIKDFYFHARWGKEQYKKGMRALEDMIPCRRHINFVPPTTTTELQTPEATPLLATEDEQTRADPRDEMRGYLLMLVEKTDNILHWWGHNTSCPTLATKDAGKHMDTLIAELDEQCFVFPNTDAENVDSDVDEFIM